jgi:hypothetical protein
VPTSIDHHDQVLRHTGNVRPAPVPVCLAACAPQKRQPLWGSAEPGSSVLRFRRINTDETHTLTVVHNQRLSIDSTLRNTVITINRSSAVGNVTPEQVDNGEKNERDDYWCELTRAKQRWVCRGIQPRIFGPEKESVKWNVARICDLPTNKPR